MLVNKLHTKQLKNFTTALIAMSVINIAVAAPATPKKAVTAQNAATVTEEANENKTTLESVRVIPTPSEIVNYPLAKLDWVEASGGLSLSGVTPKKSIRYNVKKDELVTDAKFDLYYTPSPSLIPVRSMLNVYLNGLLVKTIPILKEDLGVKTHNLVDLDPRAIGDNNLIEFEFIGHYTDYCENIVNSCLWLNISAMSELIINQQKLHVANDLASFPTPFFNLATNDRTVLPFVFATAPDDNTLKAASIVASYGGVLTQWRGIDYPVYIDELPQNDHAIVFITNDKRPYFLKDYPQVKVPSIEMADIPNTLTQKMLIVSAPTPSELITAAKALAVGNVLFNGPVTEILDYQEVAKRKAYDAPNWIDTSKKVTFGSLAEFDSQLSSQGYKPIPINLNLALPPDLYFINGSRVDMNLLYKYTKPSPLGISQLRFLINDHLMSSYPLKPDTESNAITENMPLIGTLNLFSKAKMDTSFLQPSNKFTFDFNYSIVFSSLDGQCNTSIPVPNRVEIDPNSTIDFSGLYHFTQMPNLELFWKSGYPFSIYADLQDTAVMVNNSGSVLELNSLFNILGRIGSQLGYSATNIDVITDIESNKAKERVKDKNILVIGKIPEFLNNDDNAHIVLDKTKQILSTSFNDNQPNRFDIEKKSVAQKIKTKSFEGLGALVSYKSPLNDTKTVVAVVADSNKGFAIINNNAIINNTPATASGSITIFKADEHRSYDVGDTYYVGDLPWYQRMYYMLLDNPWLLMLLSIFASIIFCFVGYKILKRIQKERFNKTAFRKAQ